MKRLNAIFHAVVYCLTLIELLDPAAVLAQLVNVQQTNDVVDYSSKREVLGGSFVFQASPLETNSPLPPDFGFQSNGSGYTGTWIRPLTLTWESTQASAWVSYSLTGPGRRYPLEIGHATPWNSSMMYGTTLYLTRSKATSASVTTDWETYGQELVAANSSMQLRKSLTMEWEVTRVVSLDKRMTRLLEFGVAGCDQWLGLRSGMPLPNSSPTGGTPFRMHAVGLETNFMLPAKNLSFSFKYEPDYLKPADAQRRIIMVGGSWTW